MVKIPVSWGLGDKNQVALIHIQHAMQCRIPPTARGFVPRALVGLLPFSLTPLAAIGIQERGAWRRPALAQASSLQLVLNKIDIGSYAKDKAALFWHSDSPLGEFDFQRPRSP